MALTSSASASEPLLEAVGIRRVLDGRLVVDVDALRVPRGSVVALLGPNGAGKSTLLRILLLLERPDAGVVRFEGRPVAPGDAEFRRAVAATMQRASLFSGTVLSNAAYGLRARGLARAVAEHRARSLLAELELGERADDDVRTLSGGEAQRVAVARALAVRPALLALDEPTAGFDVAVRRRFRELLEGLIREHAGACLLVTHDPAEAFLLADQVHVLEAGRIVQVGAPDELVLEPATPFVATFTGAELMLDGTVLGRDDATVEVRTMGGARLVAVAAADAGLGAGARVHVAYRPEDVLLAESDADAQTSARNRLRLRVQSCTPTGGLLRVRLGGNVGLVALVTRPAAERLGLAAGREVTALVKATALRAFPAQTRTDTSRQPGAGSNRMRGER